MRKIDSEEIKINVDNARFEANNNKLVRVAYLLLSFIYLCHMIFFGISAVFIDTFYGGLMSCVFIAGYMISAYLIIRRDQDSTFISLLYLVLIYAIPCCWMGISYVIKWQAKPYDWVSFVICIIAMVLAIVGIVYYYRNNFKFSSIYGLIAMIVSILALVVGGTAEIIRSIEESYWPLVGITFYVEAACGVLPLVYLFKTV